MTVRHFYSLDGKRVEIFRRGRDVIVRTTKTWRNNRNGPGYGKLEHRVDEFRLSWQKADAMAEQLDEAAAAIYAEIHVEKT